MSSLPPGWTMARVGDLIELSPKNECADDTYAGFVPLQRLGTAFRAEHSFEIRKWRELKRGYTHFANGDVLLARITPSFENGKAGIARNLPNGIGAGSTEYFVCRPKRDILLPKYLLAFFKTADFLRNGEQVMSGAVGQQRVPKQYLLDAKIPLAPLAEQRRIVDKLDRLLAAVDTCQARLDAIPAILKRFRQSVIAAATSGELTAEWRADRGLSGWTHENLADLLLHKPRNGYSPKSVDFETPVRTLTLTATTSGRFDAAHFKYVDELIPTDSHLWLRPGDILIQRANTLEYVGVSCIYDGPEKCFIYPDLMMKAVPNERVRTKYLHYCLLSNRVRDYFRKNATGTAGNMPKINQRVVMEAPIVLPSMKEQDEIIDHVEIVLSISDQLNSRFTAASDRVERLAQSLLAKAFRGELVTQQRSHDLAAEHPISCNP